MPFLNTSQLLLEQGIPFFGRFLMTMTHTQMASADENSYAATLDSSGFPTKTMGVLTIAVAVATLITLPVGLFEGMPKQRSAAKTTSQKLKEAGLNDEWIKKEIKRRGKHADNFALVLLQLHKLGKLTDNVKKALESYQLETFDQCIVAIINFVAIINSGTTAQFTSKKRNLLKDKLLPGHCCDILTMLFNNQLLSLHAINQVFRVHQRYLNGLSESVRHLHEAGILSSDIFDHLLRQLPALNALNEILDLLEMNRLLTTSRAMQLIDNPWLLTEKAREAIWSKVGDMSATEYQEIIRGVERARLENREPTNDDFQGLSGEMSPPFVFFAPPKVTLSAGKYAEQLKDFTGDIDERFFCPCTQQIMTNPVRIAGQPKEHIFEEGAIKSWIKTRPINPLNNSQVDPNVALIPVTELKAEINEFVKDLESTQQVGNLSSR